MPDDVVVLDEDGAVVIPQALVDDVLADAPEQERMEAWIMREVEKRRGAARSLSNERGDQGSLRGVEGRAALPEESGLTDLRRTLR